MANFSFEVEIRTDATNSTGQKVSEFEIVVHIHDSNMGNFSYPMSVRSTDGFITHDAEKLKREFPSGQLRLDMMSEMKAFIKSIL